MNINNQTLLYILTAALCALALTQLARRLWKRYSPSARKTRFYIRLFETMKYWDPASGPVPKEFQDMLDLLSSTVNDEKTPTENPMIYWLYGMVFMLEDKPWYDYEGVFRVLQRRAEQDDAECQFLLGNFLKRGGKGFKADPVTGEDWIRRALRNGVRIELNED